MSFYIDIDNTRGGVSYMMHDYYKHTLYRMYVEDDSVKIDAFCNDDTTMTSFDTYEVAMLFPVSKDANASGHLDMLVVLNKNKHIVACLDNADWIVAFIQCKHDSDHIEVYEKMFNDIIKQIHLEVVNYVGK